MYGGIKRTGLNHSVLCHNDDDNNNNNDSESAFQSKADHTRVYVFCYACVTP